MPTRDDLRYYQTLPLDLKVAMSKQRIYEAFDEFLDSGLYCSISGGKDSTVLADIMAQVCAEMNYKLTLCFSDTGLEYADNRIFAKNTLPNYLRDKYHIDVSVDVVKPKIIFSEVISKFGYPLISKEVAYATYYARDIGNTTPSCIQKRNELMGKRVQADGSRSRYNKQRYYAAATELPFKISHQCCNVMKKHPLGAYEKNTGRIPVIGTMTEENQTREQAWLKDGCNAFSNTRPNSKPLSFWTSQDILAYIKQEHLPLSPVYGEIVEDQVGNSPKCTLRCTKCQRSGCVFCLFGALNKADQRLIELAQISPQQFDYCMRGGAMG